ncbi:hypothetical protein GFC01_15665 [Desulfofundulus thermobenzoicus]|uniref:Uncharacterized protein n=1 Tax=Desulfofundulus thermobenzoicus TaxID=29376 RepID=A0A6N7IUU4_9FIRM|nr:hypothetical protein [Desulfofundulus thermobenzoicus]MQL53671.1 hypothetical protein [Desulfofundulus thermobenzoicus]
MSNLVFKLKRIRLQKVNAQLLSDDSNSGKNTFDIKQEIAVEIDVPKEKQIKINVSEKITAPELPFIFDIDVVGYFSSSVPVSREEIQEMKIPLSQPLFSFISLIVGFLTEKMFSGPPLILPPFYPEDEEDECEDVETADKTGWRIFPGDKE